MPAIDGDCEVDLQPLNVILALGRAARGNAADVEIACCQIEHRNLAEYEPERKDAVRGETVMVRPTVCSCEISGRSVAGAR